MSTQQVPVLKEQLTALGLETTGLKDALVERLAQARQQSPAVSAAAQAAPPTQLDDAASPDTTASPDTAAIAAQAQAEANRAAAARAQIDADRTAAAAAAEKQRVEQARFAEAKRLAMEKVHAAVVEIPVEPVAPEVPALEDPDEESDSGVSTHEHGANAGGKLTKNAKRRQKKKEQKKQEKYTPSVPAASSFRAPASVRFSVSFALLCVAVAIANRVLGVLRIRTCMDDDTPLPTVLGSCSGRGGAEYRG